MALAAILTAGSPLVCLLPNTGQNKGPIKVYQSYVNSVSALASMPFSWIIANIMNLAINFFFVLCLTLSDK